MYICHPLEKKHTVKSVFIPFVNESESEVAQSCPTLCDPIDCSAPGSSVHGIFQPIVLEWIAISFSRGSSQPRAQTWVSHNLDRRRLYSQAEVCDKDQGSLVFFLLQFPKVGLLTRLGCVQGLKKRNKKQRRKGKI